MNDSLFHGDILVAGVPRSGSTWLGSKLAEILDMEYIHEPDNEKDSVDGLLGKRRLRRFPTLREAEGNVEYGAVWRCPMHTGGKLDQDLVEQAIRAKDRGEWLLADRLAEQAILSKKKIHLSSSETRVVKSVHSALCLPTVYRAGGFKKCIIIIRPLVAVVSSWLRNSMNDSLRAVDDLQADYLNSPQNCASDINAVMKMLIKAGRMQSALIHYADEVGAQVIKYPEIITTPEATVERILRNLGIDPGKVKKMDIFIRGTNSYISNREKGIIDTVKNAMEQPGYNEYFVE